MKNIVVVILLFFFSVGAALAQEINPNKFYFRCLTSKPFEVFGKVLMPKENGSSFYNTAGAIEIGSLFYFDALSIGEKFKFGIDINYLSASRVALGMNTKVGTISIEESIKHYNIGSKLGPVFTYNVLDKLSFDVFAKVNPIWAYGFVEDLQNKNPLEYDYGFLGFKFGFGLNVRYDFIMLGAELNFGHLQYKSQIDYSDIGGMSSLSLIGDNLPKATLSLGFCF